MNLDLFWDSELQTSPALYLTSIRLSVIEVYDRES